MCITCGCGSNEQLIEGKPINAETHVHAPADVATHGHTHASGDSARFVARTLGAAHAHGIAPSRTVQIEEDILAKNDGFARENRHYFAEHGIFALNVMSSPGSGKTSLLVRTIGAWQERAPIAVIEGDQRTARDADRIRAAGARAVQINTGKGCHLDAHMVMHATQDLGPSDDSLLLIENVGNLVCPASFDLGEARKIVILSVTEGEDKPLKYPDMFRAADLMLINKIDLLPYVNFNVAEAIEFARRVRPGLEAISVSAQTGEGIEAWLAWIERGLIEARGRRESEIGGLRRRVALLEAELARQAEAAARIG